MQFLDKRLGGKSSRNLTNIAQYGIKPGAGKKGGSQRNRKRKPEVLETVTSIQQNSPIKKLKIILRWLFNNATKNFSWLV